jgi:hypothetical protein
VKLFGATVLLGTVIFVNAYAPFKIKKGQGPDPKIMKIVAMIVRLSGIGTSGSCEHYNYIESSGLSYQLFLRRRLLEVGHFE